LLLNASTTLSVRSKTSIIGANIIREQLELIKNLRDTNFLRLNDWDSLKNTEHAASLSKLETGFYTIENAFGAGNPTKIEKLTLTSADTTSIKTDFKATPSKIRLCLDSR